MVRKVRSNAGKIVGSALLALLCSGSMACKASPAAADLIMFDGKFLTMDARGSVVQAVAVRDGKIIAVGADAAIERWRDSKTRMVDMNGQTVLPGFIDGHVHPQVAIRMKSYLDAHYSEVPSLAGLVARST